MSQARPNTRSISRSKIAGSAYTERCTRSGCTSMESCSFAAIEAKFTIQSVAVSTLIVGGGIGGRSLARELALRKLPVTVLERAPRNAPVGAGIIMNPNAMRVLERNGLAHAIRAKSWPYLQRETRDRRGRLLAVRDYRP